MCGIVGYVGNKKAIPILIAGLKRLEYRGYDSAGLAVITGGALKVVKTIGRPAGLAEKLRGKELGGDIGIGHTRWATHGRVAIRNAHPLVAGRVAVVHNGILENVKSVKRSLLKRGVKFRSETDTEVLPHLIDLDWKRSLLDTVLAAIAELEGGLTCCVISTREPDQIVAVRKGNPMVIGFGEGEYFAASEASAIAPHTERMVFLQDGEVAVLSHDGVQFMDFDGKHIEHTPMKISWSPVLAEKRGYRHFLLKEIVESPRAVRDTIATCIPLVGEKASPEEFSFPCKIHESVDKVIFCGTGSSYSAAMLGQWMCEAMTGLPSSRQIASEFQYSHRVVDDRSLYVAVSQSGETLDMLEAVRYALERGAQVMAVTNNPDSSLAQLAHEVLITEAGPEISVASSKTFTATVMALTLLSFHLGRVKGHLDEDRQRRILKEIITIPEKLEAGIMQETFLRRLAEKFASHRSFFFIGRGLHYSVAHYAALMTKEVANIHGEAVTGGEIKHGPISLIEEDTPIMYFANQETQKKPMLNDIDELRARGAHVIATGLEGDPEMPLHCDYFVPVKSTLDALAPLLSIVPAQLFIYYIALYNKKDIDRPRNIAKSVTV